MDMAAYWRCHTRAIAHFGGVPARSVVTGPNAVIGRHVGPARLVGAVAFDRVLVSPVNRLTKRLGEASGVSGRHHPRKWRHTYATRLLGNGVDIHKIQRLLGHADIKTTVLCLHLVDDDLRPQSGTSSNREEEAGPATERFHTGSPSREVGSGTAGRYR